MNRFQNLSFCLTLFVACLAFMPPALLVADEKPNILWITSEDNAAHWMGCYGNEQAKTPNIDALAKRGITFSHAYSNAPVCAVARCTLLHGVYSVTLGTQHMRSRYQIPKKIKPYVSYLRENGYYCTNNSKTDYNRAGDDRAIWDECGRKAHFRNREKGQPFFTIFNLAFCHESSLFSERVAKNRERGAIPKQTRIEPKEIDLPPYLPDLPEIRNDFAIYHDNLTAMDKQVGKLLEELKQDGESDNTIVFYYSDHGGPTPRGKRYLTDTGVRVPLLVHVPARWKDLAPFKPDTTSSEPVSFIDFAPTVLSLTGLKKPEQMQGRAFLGQHRKDAADEFVFLFGDRFDELIGMRRAVTNGKYKYIRRFMPHLPAAPYSYYQFSMPSWVAWRKAWRDGGLQPRYNQIWQKPQACEELYDLEKDPWEINNVVGDSKYGETLTKLRGVLASKMNKFRDSGVVPESMFSDLDAKTTFEYFEEGAQAYSKLLQAAETATSKSASVLDLRRLMKSENRFMQYWGAIGCAAKGVSAQELISELNELAKNPNATLRISAAIAMERIGERDKAITTLLKELDCSLTDNELVLMCNAFVQLKCTSRIPKSWIKKSLKGENQYLKRFAIRLQADKPQTTNQ